MASTSSASRLRRTLVGLVQWFDADHIPEGREALWTSERMDWVLRASHESSVTLGGSWLIGLVKQHWPEWQDHLYRGFPYERPSPPELGPSAVGEGI